MYVGEFRKFDLHAHVSAFVRESSNESTHKYCFSLKNIYFNLYKHNTVNV